MPSLEERIRKVEDQLEIYNVISAYGPVVDGRNVEAIERIYAVDGIYDVRGVKRMDGLGEIKDMMRGDGHNALTGRGAAHVGTLPHVEIDGDKATATNYSILLHRRDGHSEMVRFSISRIYLSRHADGWRIDMRITDPLDGRESARALAARVFEGPAAGRPEK
jgi:hypothetical protein